MSRRGESIYKRADGRWEARYIHHYENGKAKYRFLYAKSYTEVKAKRIEEQNRSNHFCTSGCHQSASFEEVAALWLAERKDHVKESTYAQYYRIISHYLSPYFGKQRLIKLDLLFCKSVFRELSQHGVRNGTALSDKTVSDMVCVCKSIFRYGKQHGYPCADLSELSQNSAKKHLPAILTEKKRRIIEEAFLKSDVDDFDYRVHLGILFALYTGVRIGELCGVRYGDIDMSEHTVTICRTVERISDLSENAKSKTKLIISEPKTEHSVRVIPLPSFLMMYIQNSSAKANCYLLTGTQKPTEPHQFYLRYQTFMRRNGISGFTFHTLRHTFATCCVEAGVDAKSLSEILGHSNINTTLSLYVHPTLEQKKKQMEKLIPLCEF